MKSTNAAGPKLGQATDGARPQFGKPATGRSCMGRPGLLPERNSPRAPKSRRIVLEGSAIDPRKRAPNRIARRSVASRVRRVREIPKWRHCPFPHRPACCVRRRHGRREDPLLILKDIPDRERILHPSVCAHESKQSWRATRPGSGPQGARYDGSPDMLPCRAPTSRPRAYRSESATSTTYFCFVDLVTCADSVLI